MLAYLKNPEEIYRQSFAAIREEVDLSGLNDDVARIATRLIHASGMPEILDGLHISPDFPEAVRSALATGAPVLVDVEMVRHAIISRHLPAGSQIICTLNEAQTAHIARAENTTRSAAAVDLWADHLRGAIVVIGNAPTALFRLLELIDDGAPKPAAIAAFPVGFVGAAESKQELQENPRGIPYATLLGRLGGSAMAGAAINALFAGAR